MEQTDFDQGHDGMVGHDLLDGDGYDVHDGDVDAGPAYDYDDDLLDGGAGEYYVLDDVVVEVGDIAVSPQWVHLPDGPHPLRDSHWTVSDQVHESTEIPSYAIVLAVIFFVVFLLGLLFLLIKERTVQGVIHVSVEGDGYHHVTQVPVASYVGVSSVHQRVAYIRHLAAAA
ncbi:MAG TPA: hypothetical protein VFM27_06340 [Acidimicrobiales bacterium]|nr:hypothetical protein [Acidimicrobiales bacterium]